VICFNGAVTRPFKRERGVRSRCFQAPYPFILINEVLSFMVKETIRMGNLKGVMLPKGTREQTTFQYIDDTKLLCPKDVGGKVFIGP
jgi:hypothetical protein